MNSVLATLAAASLGSVLLFSWPRSDRAVQQNMLQRCQQAEVNALTTERDTLPSGEGKVSFRNGLNLFCPIERRRLRADSAHHFERQQRLELFGNVSYVERTTQIAADRMIYYRKSDHVEATSNVKAQLEGGSTVMGRHIAYYAKHPQLRPKDSLRAIQRPVFTLVERDTLARTADTTRLDAENVFLHGDEVFASGMVVVRRSELDATSDSMYANRDPNQRMLRFMRNPKLTGKGANVFTMTGRQIEIEAGKTRQIERVKSLAEARVVNSDLDLMSDTIHMQLTDKKISGTRAWGDSAHLESRGATIRGKTLDILLPGGELTEIRARTSALALFPPDTTKILTNDKDFMKGDTIVLQFERFVQAARPAPRDSILAGAPAMSKPDTSRVPRHMLAIGKASLLVQRAATGAGADKTCPSVHYWSGETIEASFRDREVTDMKVRSAGKNMTVSGIQSDCSEPGTGRGGRAGRSGRGGAVDTSGTTRIPPP